MIGPTAKELASRRARLARVARDLSDRIEQRFGAAGPANPSDPLYQRLRFALKRVRRELEEADAALRHS